MGAFPVSSGMRNRCHVVSAVCTLLVVSMCLTALNVPTLLEPDVSFEGAPIAVWDGDPRERFTIVLNTWRRHELVVRAAQHYRNCPLVAAVRVVWSEPEPVPEELLRLAAQEGQQGRRKAELEFDIHEEDSLNNRFKPLRKLGTDAVFSVDDDLLVPCDALGLAFEVWRAAPDSMVGFVPRLHRRIPRHATLGNYEDDGRFKYLGWWSVWWSGSYSMVLTKAAFFHHKYLSLYTHSLPASIREYVHLNRNCEDIAMAFLVANETKAQPIWVQGKLREAGAIGISSATGHIERRSRCLNDFAAMFDGMPLVTSHVKVIDGRSGGLW